MHRRVLAGALVLGCAAGLAGQAVPPGTGLVAYWTLNDGAGTTAAETAGSGPVNTGTYMGTTLPATSASVPMVGGLAHPPGNTASRVFSQTTSGQRVQAADAADLDLTGSFTLAAWVNPTGALSEQMGILEHWSSGASAINGTFLRLSSTLFPKASIGNGAVQHTVQAPAALSAGVWSHVAATYDAATQTFRFYVNGGTPDATLTAVPAPTAASSALHIGADYGSNRFNGNIDEARIYDRRLSDAEIGVLFGGLPAPVLAAPAPGPGRVDLSWGAVANATSYQVFQGASATGPWTLVGTPTGTSFTDMTVLHPTAYWYQVVAVGLIESHPSNVQGPVVPQSLIPRTNDHEEGLIDDNCACGSTIPPAAASWPALLALLAWAVRRRRS